MPDHYPFAQDWIAQGCRPIGTGEGKHDGKWKDFQRRDPTVYERHRWWTGKRQANANIALMLGPKPGGDVLFLNINVKNGADGPGTLHRLGWDLIIPATPTIRTQSGGLAHAFKVPDPAVYPFPFKTHANPTGFEGLEFRGTGGYQLVPPSRTPIGAYTFVEPWTLARFREQLADLPGAILQAWIRLDSPKILARDNPGCALKPRKHASAAVLPTDLSQPQAQQPNRSHARPAPEANTHPQYLTTITTTLLPCDYTDFDGGEVEQFDEGCAAHVCRLVGLDVASLVDGRSFCCIVPGHEEAHPSATWFKTNSGHFIYHDWHVRSGEEFLPVPDVFAAIVTGKLKKLPKPSRKTWRLRLMIEAGLLDPYPVDMKPLPDDMPKLLRHFCERFRYLIACKWTYQERAPTMFSDEFAAGWCGIREGTIWKLRRLAIAHGFLVVSKDEKGRLVYLPGKDA